MTQPRAYEKRLFFVPSWVWKVIQRNKLSREDFMNYNKIKEYLTDEDLACLWLINDRQNIFIGSAEMNFSWAYTSNVDEAKMEHILEISKAYEEEFATRLFSENDVGDKPFEIIDIDTDTFVIVIYPGHFGLSTANQNRFNLARELLKIEYNRNNFTTCAKKSYFSPYLDQLIKANK